jgi:glutathione S-transferase
VPVAQRGRKVGKVFLLLFLQKKKTLPVILHYVPGSPYARMIRIAWRERGIAGITEHETTLRDPASDLLPHNPVGRVPTLVLADGTALTETLLILTHLDRLHQGPRLIPETPQGLAELGQVFGLLDGIAVWNRELRRPPHERSPGVIALEETRANRTATRLEAAPPTHPTARLALACALGYCERRHTAWPWRQGRPALSAWFDGAAATPLFQATLPPISGL